MQVATTNLVFGVEVWRPDDSQQTLSLHSSVIPEDIPFANDRHDLALHRNETPVGAAWASGIPVIEKLGDSTGDPDSDSELSTRIVAIPTMQNGNCRGVVALLCESGSSFQGAFEVWKPNERAELALSESWHPSLERFGTISSFVKFPRRSGLPGKVWSDRFPRVLGALGKSPDFMRAAGAKAEGLSTGIGIPFMKSARELEAVLVMLSAVRSPIAHVCEVWAFDPEIEALRIVSADYGPFVDLAPVSRRLKLKHRDGIAGRVYTDGAPWVTKDLLGVEFPRGNQFSEYGFEWGVGLPVYVGDELVAVVTLIR